MSTPRPPFQPSSLDHQISKLKAEVDYLKRSQQAYVDTVQASFQLYDERLKAARQILTSDLPDHAARAQALALLK